MDRQPFAATLYPLYRFITHRRHCDLRFGLMSQIRQDRGSGAFACST